ncbi:MAG: DUF721 domain-containing protein [Bacteroidales bacterium]|nr:DUF721 domain-containing protein [Bacteroidales bacterium]
MIRQKSIRLGDILDACIPENSTLGKGLLGARIKNAYSQTVGSSAAAATMNVTFKEGTLRCKISSSVYRMHLAANKDEIIKSINALLGKEQVKSIIFT